MGPRGDRTTGQGGAYRAAARATGPRDGVRHRPRAAVTRAQKRGMAGAEDGLLFRTEYDKMKKAGWNFEAREIRICFFND